MTQRGNRKPRAHKRARYRWTDPDGRQITAAGILLYDERGVWLAVEKQRGMTEYTDPGGKYQFEDGDAIACACRELREETYNEVEIPVKKLKELSQVHPPIYVEGRDGKPTYICYPVPLNQVEVEVVPEKIRSSRVRVLSQNPQVPTERYSIVDYEYIPYQRLRFKRSQFSYRLRNILRQEPFRQHMTTPTRT